MSAAHADATPVVLAQQRAPKEYKAVVDFLRGKNGPKVRRGILHGKRVDYFKGKTAVRTLTSPAYQKLSKVPKVENEEEAMALMAKVLPHAFFLRVDRPEIEPPPPSGTPKTLNLAPQQSFDPLVFYAWFYDGSPLATYLGGAAMVLVILAGVMFPLWPVKLRLGVWYLSVLALIMVGLLIALAIVRGILFVITWFSMKRAIWIFPNLFEDVGFFASFVPLWAWDEPKKKKKRVKKERSRIVADTDPVDGAEASGEPDVDDIAATSTAIQSASLINGTVKNRHAATVEDDDEI
ncbi:hypothetical protein M231_03471 [Tremella mesenterica]|uniref:Translocation protein SEC62 n=1 Tax=Tremella mesenterica TaxID=5217 RepID=A0A4Q1BN22_TREME|nr:hypothetical protein M231_03471 [Tremella mesenterica]